MATYELCGVMHQLYAPEDKVRNVTFYASQAQTDAAWKSVLDVVMAAWAQDFHYGFVVLEDGRIKAVYARVISSKYKRLEFAP